MKKIKNFILKRKICIFLIILLLIVSCCFYKQNIDYNWNQKYLERFPHLPLIKSVFDNGDCTHINITGFVAFNNLEDQSKTMKQYQTIEDDNWNCTFLSDKPKYYLTNFYKMKYAMISKSYDRDELEVVSNEKDLITLKDEYGNRYMIGKNYNDNIYEIDTQGDRTRLITNQLDFRKFIENWQKYRDKK